MRTRPFALSLSVSFLHLTISTSLLRPLFQIIVHIFFYIDYFPYYLYSPFSYSTATDKSSLYPSRLLPFLNMHFKKIETLLSFGFLFIDIIFLSSPICYLCYAAARLSFIFYFYPGTISTSLSFSVSVSFISSHTSFPFLLCTLPSFPSSSNVCHFLFLSQPDTCSFFFLNFFVGQFLFSFLESLFSLHDYVSLCLSILPLYDL